jgi:hypothetical protein
MGPRPRVNRQPSTLFVEFRQLSQLRARDRSCPVHRERHATSIISRSGAVCGSARDWVLRWINLLASVHIRPWGALKSRYRRYYVICVTARHHCHRELDGDPLVTASTHRLMSGRSRPPTSEHNCRESLLLFLVAPFQHARLLAHHLSGLDMNGNLFTQSATTAT